MTDNGDPQKAQAYFDRGRDVADAGNFDYAIDLFLHGLSLDPDNIFAHKELRFIAIERKARGGKDIGSFEKIELRKAIATSNDHKRALFIAEKLFAYDPGSIEWITAASIHARKAGFEGAAKWLEQLLEIAAGE
ncbi:MAG TPA: hypothetical protein VGR35_08135 [Tepidisphaeraceae bacterium]|nr:hypothetical protein [Tepidisphaeraceae bacterium]